jgi:thiol-disulfide isomerase/thioredoxin
MLMSRVFKQKTTDTEKAVSLDEEVKQKEKAFILFYASWCPFSLRFLPIFEEYAKSKPQECVSVVIDDKPDLCEEYAIEYYPTVLQFKNGKLRRRLDAKPGFGLTKEQFKEFTNKP